MWWIFFSLLFAPSILAQTVDLYQRSIQAGTVYRTAYSEYQVARNQHQQYNTGATSNAAIVKTNAVLTARNNWQISFLQHLRTVLAEVTNIANYPQTVVYLDLETEINALEGLKSSLPTGSTFEAINQNSTGWESRLKTSDRLVEAAQLQVSSSKLEALQTKLSDMFTAFRQANATPSPELGQSINQISAKITQASTMHSEANNLLTNYKTRQVSKQAVTKILIDSQQLLLDAAKLLVEVAR